MTVHEVHTSWIYWKKNLSLEKANKIQKQKQKKIAQVGSS
jgi:hypothetical protein